MLLRATNRCHPSEGYDAEHMGACPCWVFHIRCTPESGHVRYKCACLLWARSGHQSCRRTAYCWICALMLNEIDIRSPKPWNGCTMADSGHSVSQYHHRAGHFIPEGLLAPLGLCCTGLRDQAAKSPSDSSKHFIDCGGCFGLAELISKRLIGESICT